VWSGFYTQRTADNQGVNGIFNWTLCLEIWY